MPLPPEREPRKPDWRVLLDRYAAAWEHYSQQPIRHNLQQLQTGEELLLRELLTKPGKFPLGQLVMTPGADQAMTKAGHIPPEFLLRHGISV